MTLRLMDKWADVGMYKISLLYRTLSPDGAAAQKGSDIVLIIISINIHRFIIIFIIIFYIPQYQTAIHAMFKHHSEYVLEELL